MKLLRLFVAIELSQNLKEEIAKIEWQLAKQNLPFRYEDETKLHLTLAFLGNTKETRIKKLEAVFREVAKNSKIFVLGINNLGAFPGFNHPRVLCLSLTGDIGELESLQSKTLTALKESGFQPKINADFTPHIALARFSKPPYPIHMKNVGNKISGLKLKIPQLEFTVNSLSLIQSKLNHEGSVYKTLAEFSFK